MNSSLKYSPHLRRNISAPWLGVYIFFKSPRMCLQDLVHCPAFCD
jgi:hypothetical protein